MEQNIIYAKDGEIEKSYLLVISPTSVYKLTIKKINKTENNKGDVSVSSVSVLDERYPGQLNTISGDTYLLEYDEEFYKKSKSLRKEKEKPIIKNEEKINQNSSKLKETKPVARTKNPRSVIIDKYLKEVPEGQKVNSKEIAQKVLEQTKEPEDHLKKVIAEVNVRNWMFSKGGKVNKFKNV